MVVFIKLRKKRPINVGYLKRFPRFHSFFLSKNRKNERNTIMKAFLILEDGHVFEGKSIGSTDEIISEIVLNTSATTVYAERIWRLADLGSQDSLLESSARLLVISEAR